MQNLDSVSVTKLVHCCIQRPDRASCRRKKRAWHQNDLLTFQPRACCKTDHLPCRREWPAVRWNGALPGTHLSRQINARNLKKINRAAPALAHRSGRKAWIRTILCRWRKQARLSFHPDLPVMQPLLRRSRAQTRCLRDPPARRVHRLLEKA